MTIEHMPLKQGFSLTSKETDLLKLPNVTGVARCERLKGEQKTGELAVVAFVTHKHPAERLAENDKVPPEIDGVPTDVQPVGILLAGASYSGTGIDIGSAGPPIGGYDIGSAGPPIGGIDIGSAGPPIGGIDIGTAPVTPSQALRRRRRPAMGGDSIGHPQVTAGTIATCCYDATAFPGTPSRTYMLSNNHVLANSNIASSNDPILQPAALDGGTAPRDIIARLSRYVPIQFMSDEQTPPCNLVDAAIAEGEFYDLNREIYWIGHVQGINESPNIDDVMVKTGRTTNFTTGIIRAIDATVDVNYRNGRVARFRNQIVTSNMTAGGDSGCLGLDIDKRAVGLMFAGSPVVTIFNPIADVLSLLHIRLTEK